MSDLAYMSATRARELFAAGELSPVELMQAVIARAEAVEPTVNALCHTFFDDALAQARAAEARYAGRGEPPRALEGIPLAVKAEEAIAGQPWSQGSLIDKDAVADRTSTFARRMLDAGAIVHARTTLPEFGAAGFTRSKLWGITRNPWNPEYGAGGSSGGSGAALAAGTTTLASGSDMAGSIRIPAAFNGVVGFKPPYGRVPVDPPMNLDTYMHCGPMARTVADAALLQNVVAGPAEDDIVSLRPKLELPTSFDGVAGLRVALSIDLGDWPVDPEIRENTLRVAELLRGAGAVVELVDLSLPRQLVDRAAAIHYGPGATWLNELIAEHPGLATGYLEANVARLLRNGEGGTAVEGLAIEAELYASLAAVLSAHDALVCPTVGMRGLLADDEYTDKAPFDVGGETIHEPEAALLTVPFNILGRCPVLAVPSGFADNGLPTGVQIVGRTYDDETVFRVGAAIEQALPPMYAPDRRPPVPR